MTDTDPLPRVEVHKVEPGSLVVLYGIELGDPEENDAMAESLAAGLKEVVGHDRFLIVTVPDPTAEVTVVGPDDLAQLLADVHDGSARRPPPRPIPDVLGRTPDDFRRPGARRRE